MHWLEAGLPEAFQVLDSDDQLRLIKRVMADLDIDETRFPPRQAAWWINAQKDEGRRAENIQTSGDFMAQTFVRVYAAYEERCRRSGLVDFAEQIGRASCRERVCQYV